jgi:hypothetical protein
MQASPTACDILDKVFLEVRGKLLEVAGSLDRLDRADGSVADDPRLLRIRQALAVLEGRQPDRAEQIQLIFSLPYESDWQQQFGLSEGRNGAARHVPKVST